jgi:hypothetical protein
MAEAHMQARKTGATGSGFAVAACQQLDSSTLAELAGMVSCTSPCTTSNLSPLKASVKRLAGLAVCHRGRLMVRGSVGWRLQATTT